MVTPDETVTVAIDNTLFRRRGPKVHAAWWFHDGCVKGDKKIGYGNNWVTAAIVVHLAFLDRPIALPGRMLHEGAGSAYASKALLGLPDGVRQEIYG